MFVCMYVLFVSALLGNSQKYITSLLHFHNSRDSLIRRNDFFLKAKIQQRSKF